MLNKITTFLGSALAAAFLIGLATTLTRSSMIGFWDVLPVFILMAIKINTGNTSQKPIIEDLVNVVARPIKNAAARAEPKNVVILFSIFFTIFFQPISYT